MPKKELPTSHWPEGAKLGLALLLLGLAIGLDYSRPFRLSFSITYLLPILYAGWTLRGRAEYFIYAISLLSTFVVPTLRPKPEQQLWLSANRWMGVGVGVVVLVLTRERRRYIEEVQRAKDELEVRVAERTMELKATNEALQRSLEVKGHFLRTMSHELRTPMNGILGMTNLLLETPLDAGQRAHLRQAVQSAEQLLALLNDILDLAKMEAGKVRLGREEFSPSAKTREVLRLVAPLAAAKGLRLYCHEGSNVAQRVWGDPLRLGQVLLNLLGNAIKFTQEGWVRVRLEAAEGWLVWEVEDSGIGMTEAERRQVFEAFWQADASVSRNYEGSGLGLTISQELVELMRGEILIESEKGKGSCFRLRLPLEVAEGAATERWGVGKRVRLQVSDAESRESLRQMLEEAGAEICEDGEWVLADREWSSGEGEAPRKLLRLGDEGLNGEWLSEPVMRADLKAALAESGAAPAVEAACDEGGGKRILLVEDNAVNRYLAERLLAKKGHTVVTVENGLDALAAWEGESFDCIVMDIQMPLMSGVEVTERIRQLERERGGHVPILALTAHAMKEEEASYLAAGMDAFVAKPIRAGELYAAIDALTAGRQGA